MHPYPLTPQDLPEEVRALAAMLDIELQFWQQNIGWAAVYDGTTYTLRAHTKSSINEWERELKYLWRSRNPDV